MDPYGTYVKTLYYTVKTPEHFKYESPAPVNFETDKASFQLADGELVVTPKADFPTVPAARAAIDPTLEAWGVLADLQYSRGEFRLAFQRAQMAYRNPPPSRTIIATAAHLRLGALTATITGTATPLPRRTYPAPPIDFVLSADAKSMHERLAGVDADREPLLSAAYFCLTVVESLGAPPKNGRRRRAAQLLAIDDEVLKTLGELTSAHGGPLAGRKASSTKPLTNLQVHWIRQVLHKMIVRVGQRAAGASLIRITMTDFPRL